MKIFSRKITLSYILADLAGSSLGWSLFYLFHHNAGKVAPEAMPGWHGVVITPLLFLFIFAMAGFYSDPLRRSRLHEFGKSVITTLGVAVILFFVLVMNDAGGYHSSWYRLFAALFMLLFLFTYIPRLSVTSVVTAGIHSGRRGFRTVIVGSGVRAVRVIAEIMNEKPPSGNLLTGYSDTGSKYRGDSDEMTGVKWLGPVSRLTSIIEEHSIDEVILALEDDQYHLVEEIVNNLCFLDVIVKAVPSMRTVITGHVEAGPIYATPLLRVSYRGMPRWQAMIKLLLDYLLSAVALVIMSPLMAVLALLIRCTGEGPLIFRQERIGRHGRPFMIYKFRSMEEDAEPDGPRLAVKGDSRITPVGRFMRKHRFDEIPNFINVLKGEMSLVGPRPERQHYIELIREQAPQYNRVLAVRPGITCWGQVKLGYASDIETMLERLSYDLLYLENMSLFLDIKIIVYTLGAIIKGKGL